MMIKRIINDFHEYMGYTVQAAKSQLKSEIASSYLNWLWWVIEPFSLMLVYVFMFGFVFNLSEQYYPVFIFLGVSLWGFFGRCVRSSTTLIRNNKSTIEKVYIPKYFLLIQNFLVNAFKLAINLVVVFGMMVVFRIPFSPMMLLSIPVMIVFFLVTFGFCTVLMHYGAFVEDLSNAISVLLNFLNYATGIFYNIDKRIPSPYNLILGRLMPVGYLIQAMRKVLIYEELPDMKLLAFWAVFGLVMSAEGIVLIYRNENNYIKVI